MSLTVNMELLAQIVSKEEVVVLATSMNDKVTARPVSGIWLDGEIYVRTSQSSEKAVQIAANPNVAICTMGFYLEGTAQSVGDTALPQNQTIKETYIVRWPEAFSEKDEYLDGDEVFIKITPKKVSQWVFENEIPLGLVMLEL